MSSVLPTSSSNTSSSGASGSVITSTGIGSGLDIGAIVSSLTTAFGAAQNAQLSAQQSTLDSQVSAYGTFTSALDTLQVAAQGLEVSSTLQGFSGTVADKTIASASTSSDAVAGQYTLLVDHLASAATLTSQAYTNSTSAVGTGALTITVGGKSSTLNIDTTDNSVAGIAAAINSATDNPGVTASIITTTAGARLVISGTSTGAANAVTVTQSGGDGGLAPLTYDPTNGVTNLTQSQAALDAGFSINGFPATSSTNVVSGAITGVTIDLLAASAPNTPTTLSVAPDATVATAAVGKFVSALNGVLSAIKTLTAYDATTQTAGALNGNATLETFQSQLQNLLGQITRGGSASIKSLADIGISASTDGSYASNATKLANALTGNLSGVLGFLSGDKGIATQIDNLVNGYTKTGGLLDNINQGLTTSLKSVSQRQDALKTQLATYATTLTKQYNAMDTAVAQLKVMQQYLNAEFNSNSGGSGSSSSSGNSSLSSGNLHT